MDASIVGNPKTYKWRFCYRYSTEGSAAGAGRDCQVSSKFRLVPHKGLNIFKQEVLVIKTLYIQYLYNHKRSYCHNYYILQSGETFMLSTKFRWTYMPIITVSLNLGHKYISGDHVNFKFNPPWSRHCSVSVLSDCILKYWVFNYHNSIIIGRRSCRRGR